MSCSGSPARSTMALPSPVQVRRGAGEIGAPMPPVARIVIWALKRWSEPSSSLMATTPAAAALVVHDEVDGEELDEELGGVAQRLAVHGVQHGVAGAVVQAQALRGALAVVGGHAAERTLVVDLAVLAARERQPPMSQLVDRLGALRQRYSMASWPPSQSAP